MKRILRLERALDALSRERKHIQRDLSEVSARRARLTRAMERLRDCRESVGSSKVVDPGGRFRTDLYLVARSAEARMTTELEGLGARLEKFDREITQPVQERLRRAAVHERAVETLLKRREEVISRDEARQETRQMDEHAHHRYRAQRGR